MFSISKLAHRTILSKAPETFSQYALFATRVIKRPDVIVAPENESLAKEYDSEINELLDKYVYRAERKQSKIGYVVSTKNSKTISVEIENHRFISKYGTTVRMTRKIMAHDDEERAGFGDLVCIVPCRPMSKRKRHKLIDIVKYSNANLYKMKLEALAKEEANKKLEDEKNEV